MFAKTTNFFRQIIRPYSFLTELSKKTNYSIADLHEISTLRCNDHQKNKINSIYNNLQTHIATQKSPPYPQPILDLLKTTTNREINRNYWCNAKRDGIFTEMAYLQVVGINNNLTNTHHKLVANALFNVFKLTDQTNPKT
jgi:hypothetical protein